MSKPILRILGIEGRTTIPFSLRSELGFECGDIISFTPKDKDTILLKREKLCDHCGGKRMPAPDPDPQRAFTNTPPAPEMTIMEMLDRLTPAQQGAALIHLSNKIMGRRNPKGSRRGCV